MRMITTIYDLPTETVFGNLSIIEAVYNAKTELLPCSVKGLSRVAVTCRSADFDSIEDVLTIFS